MFQRILHTHTPVKIFKGKLCGDDRNYNYHTGKEFTLSAGGRK